MDQSNSAIKLKQDGGDGVVRFVQDITDQLIFAVDICGDDLVFRTGSRGVRGPVDGPVAFPPIIDVYRDNIVVVLITHIRHGCLVDTVCVCLYNIQGRHCHDRFLRFGFRDIFSRNKIRIYVDVLPRASPVGIWPW